MKKNVRWYRIVVQVGEIAWCVGEMCGCEHVERVLCYDLYTSTVPMYSYEKKCSPVCVTAMFEVDLFLKGTLAEVLNFKTDNFVRIKCQNTYL